MVPAGPWTAGLAGAGSPNYTLIFFRAGTMAFHLCVLETSRGVSTQWEGGWVGGWMDEGRGQPFLLHSGPHIQCLLDRAMWTSPQCHS